MYNILLYVFINGILRLNLSLIIKTYIYSNTSGNQKGIANALKYKNVVEYRYWDEVNRNFDIKGMLEDLEVNYLSSSSSSSRSSSSSSSSNLVTL